MNGRDETIDSLGEPSRLPEPYYMVGDAIAIAGCTKRQFYHWLGQGFIAVRSDGSGPLTLTRGEVEDLRAFATAMRLPPGKLARALLTSRDALRVERARVEQLRRDLRNARARNVREV